MSADLDRDTRRRIPVCTSTWFSFVKIQIVVRSIVSIMHPSGGVCLPEILLPWDFHCTFNIITRCRIWYTFLDLANIRRIDTRIRRVASRISWASRLRSPHATRYPNVCYYSCITRYRRAHTSCRSRDRWFARCKIVWRDARRRRFGEDWRFLAQITMNDVRKAIKDT